MGMNKSYSGYCAQLMNRPTYKKFIEDADNPRTYYENIKKKYDDYVTSYMWNPITYLGEVFGEGNWKDADRYAKKKIRENTPQANEGALEGYCVNVDSVRKELQTYQSVVDDIRNISAELELLRDQLGKNKLYVDKKTYEVRIDEIIDKIDRTYRIPMQEFIDAAGERAPFVHDFQLCVAKDYYRYYGTNPPYNTKKDWSRKDSGWDL